MKPLETLEHSHLDEPRRSTGDHFPDLDGDGRSGARYWWVWVLVFSAIGYGCYRLYTYENAKKAEMAKKGASALRPRSVPISAGVAHEGNVPVYLQGLGNVTAFNTVTVKTRVDGQLVNVTFHEGQFVNKGQLLAEIDPRPYQVALDQANGALAQANGTLEKDQAALRDAQANYQRYQELFKSQIIAKQQLDTQLATADQIRGTIVADQAAIASARANIDSAKLNLTYTHIIAPLSGRIGLRLVDTGNMIHAADPTGLAVITQLQPIAVLFSIPEEELPPVLAKLRNNVKLPTVAFDRELTKKLADGTLLTVDNQIDATTGTSRLKAVFPNTDYALFPNQFVNVRLSLDTERNQVIVPNVAIQRGPSGTFVYFVNADSTVSIRPVKLGTASGPDVAIADGLQAGDKVVTDGAEKLTEGMKVTVHMANTAPSSSASPVRTERPGRRNLQ